jgi:hypothetical protein
VRRRKFGFGITFKLSNSRLLIAEWLNVKVNSTFGFAMTTLSGVLFGGRLPRATGLSIVQSLCLALQYGILSANLVYPITWKIDIEGYDGICIAGLNSAIAPQYISIEMDHLCGASDLGRLAELGYKGFKIICQNNAWHQVTTGNLAFYRWALINRSFAA